MQKLDRLGWAATGFYEIHGRGVGVRSTSAWFSDWLDRALDSYVTDTGSEPILYSVVVGENAEGSIGHPNARKLHILYRGTAAIVRTSDLQALARCLVGELGSVGLHERDDAIYLSAGALVVGGGAAALVPGYFVARLARLRRRAELSGVLLPGTAVSALDLNSGRVVPLPALDVERQAFIELANDRVSRQPDLRALIERPVELGAVLSLGPSAAPGLHPIPKALGLYRWSAKVLNLRQLGGRAVEALGQILEDVPSLEVRWEDPGTWLGDLGELLAAPSERSVPEDVDYAPRGSGNTRVGR